MMKANGIKNDTLVLVQVCFRHGDRTPATTYPSDPHKNHPYAPYGLGELTLKGKQNSLNLGKSLRESYGTFLGETYSIDLLESFSSPSNRSQATLQCVHAGLFPPVRDTQKLDQQLNWQPIPYRTFTREDDKYLGVHISQKRELDIEKGKITPEEKRRHFEFLSEKTGFKVTTSHQIFQIHNAIQSQLEYGLDVPEWCEPSWRDLLHKYTKDFWQDLIDYKHPLFVGSLIELITKHAKDRIAGSSKKIFLYAGHEMNVYMLLGAFSCYNRQDVDYCATMTFELHKINDVYGYKIYFTNKDEKTAVRLPNVKDFKDDFNPLDKVIEHTKWLYAKPEN